jgi:hypothetical protein
MQNFPETIGYKKKGWLRKGMTKVRLHHGDRNKKKEVALFEWSFHDARPGCVGGMSLWIMPKLPREQNQGAERDFVFQHK